MSSPPREDERERDRHAEFERIEPARVEVRAGPAAPARSAGAPGAPRLVTALAITGLLAAVGWVFLGLPARVSAPAATAVAPARPTAPPATTGAAEPAPDVDGFLAAREEAEGLARTLAARREALAARAFEGWSPAGAAALAERATRAAESFEQRDYAAATAAYREAIADADRRLGEAERVLDDALARGDEAIVAGDSAAAAAAFARALEISPDDPRAGSGSRRAAVLDRVLAALASGRRHRRADDLTAAREDFRAAIALDGDSRAAREALAEVESALAERAFGVRMSEGEAALGRGEASAARTAFRAAAALRPGSPEATDGVARAEVALQTSAAATLRAQAGAREAEEDWTGALAAYDEALALDGTLAFAVAGRERAAARADLAARIDAQLARPERLESDEVRATAATLLDEARGAGEPAARLRERAARLGAMLDAARTKVTVEIRSDEATEVLLYKVGRLGRFAEKQLELTPGSYTVLGRREGYRDVRLEFRVPPGGAVAPIVVACEERI